MKKAEFKQLKISSIAAVFIVFLYLLNSPSEPHPLAKPSAFIAGIILLIGLVVMREYEKGLKGEVALFFSAESFKDYIFLVMKLGGQNGPEVQGIFSTKKLAIAACKSELYVYTRLTLDESLPDETVFQDWFMPTNDLVLPAGETVWVTPEYHKAQRQSAD